MYDEYVDDDIDYESSLREITRITTLKYLDISYMRCVSKTALSFYALESFAVSVSFHNRKAIEIGHVAAGSCMECNL